MHVSHLALHDFRSYETFELDLEPGVTAFVGRNGHGKTNIVEAVDYLSRLSSHRVATDAPLDARELKRLAARAVFGLARTGSSFSNGSGDYVIAFSTAESVRRRDGRKRGSIRP